MSERHEIPEDRLGRAIHSALAASAVKMPGDLKAALKREARARAARSGPRWVERWREALAAAPWSWGLGAAFAAAALVLAARSAVAPRPAPSREVAAQMRKISADLWSDDDGSDRED